MPSRNARFGFFVVLCVVAMSLISPSLANGSLFSAQGRGAIINKPADAVAPAINNSSLFKSAGSGFFASTKRRSLTPGALTNATQIDRLRQLIETAESRKHGYNAVQLGAKIKPPKRPTEMTIAEIYDWIEATPKQHHAIGRYQFIPATLRHLVDKRDMPLNTRFSPRVQDQLADILLANAGLGRFKRGEITRHDFMKRLAKVWAGFPTSTGKSYYDGHAGNKASITWATFDREMAEIFPS